MNIVKQLTLLIALLAITSGAAQSQNIKHPPAAPDETTPLIPGTDRPQFKPCEGGTVYEYIKYTIYAAADEKMAGENISVYKRTDRGGDLCKVIEGKPDYLFNNDLLGGANFFAGLYKDYMFIDQGAGPDFRMLSIYELKDKKLILSTNYSDPVLTDGILTYYENVPPAEYERAKVPCPESGYWIRTGLTVLYQTQRSFNLKTGKKESSGKYRCTAGQ